MLGRGFFNRFEDVRARGGERHQKIPYNTIAVGFRFSVIILWMFWLTGYLFSGQGVVSYLLEGPNWLSVSVQSAPTCRLHYIIASNVRANLMDMHFPLLRQCHCPWLTLALFSSRPRSHLSLTSRAKHWRSGQSYALVGRFRVCGHARVQWAPHLQVIRAWFGV